MYRLLALLLVLSAYPTWAQDDDYTLRHQDSDGSDSPCLPPIDETITLYLMCDFADGEELLGWQWGVCHDTDFLNLEDGDVVKGSYTDDDDDGGPAVSFTFHAISVSDGGWNIGALLNPFTGDTIEPIDAAEMYCSTYTVEDTGDTDIEFCETLGDPLVTVRLHILSVELEPVQEEITLLSECGTFLRGDVDNSGTVSALLDALFLLNWAFNDGDEPECMDAADIDDNGEVSGLLDALSLLQYGFTDGDEPPDPGVDDCGVDPTNDDLGCETVADDCA